MASRSSTASISIRPTFSSPRTNPVCRAGVSRVQPADGVCAPASPLPLGAPTDPHKCRRQHFAVPTRRVPRHRGVRRHAERNRRDDDVQFPGGDYTQPPLASTFASGGFRGDLLNVGVDGCIYATQGRHAVASDHGTRYDDGTETTEDSLVKICAPPGEKFAPGPGVKETVNAAPPSCTGAIGDRVWHDLNHNGLQDAGEPGLDGVVMTLTHGADQTTTTTSGGGSYHFTGLCAGSMSCRLARRLIRSDVSNGANRAIDSNEPDACRSCRRRQHRRHDRFRLHERSPAGSASRTRIITARRMREPGLLASP